MKNYDAFDSKKIRSTSCSDSVNSICSSLPPKQFALLSTILGLLVSDNLSIDGKNAVGNFLVNIGQAIMTEAAQQQLLEAEASSSNDNLQQEIDDIKQQLALLKKEIHPNGSC